MWRRSGGVVVARLGWMGGVEHAPKGASVKTRCRDDVGELLSNMMLMSARDAVHDLIPRHARAILRRPSPCSRRRCSPAGQTWPRRSWR